MVLQLPVAVVISIYGKISVVEIFELDNIFWDEFCDANNENVELGAYLLWLSFFCFYPYVYVILVKLILYFCRVEDLRGPFGRFGPIKDIYLPKDYYTGWALMMPCTF